MVIFQVIEIKQFRSINHLNYKLDKPGLNLVLGSNGSGKSTIWNALTWCIWGKTLNNKTVEPWAHVKRDYQSTEVAVYISVDGKDIIIYRNRKRKKETLDITILGEEYQSSSKEKKLIQDEVNNLVGFSFNLFKNSVLFGQKLIRLLNESGPNQKKMFEEAFDTVFINNATIKAKESLEKLAKEKQSIEIEIDKSNTSKKHVITNLENIKDNLDRTNKSLIAIEEKYGNEKHLVKSIKAIKKELQGSEVIESKLNKLEDKHFKLSLILSQEDGELSDIKKLKSYAVNDLNDTHKTCSKCGQKLNPENQAKTRKSLKKKISEYNHQISDQKDVLKSLRKKGSTLTKRIVKTKKLKVAIHHSNNELEKLKSSLNNLRFLKSQLDNINDINIKVEMWGEQLQGWRERIKRFEGTLKKIDRKVELHNWLLRDALSNKGLKSYIFNTMLQKINSNLIKYSKRIGYIVRFYIDLESANKNFKSTIYKSDNEIEYDELSGGQKQIIDVVTAFSIHDAISDEKQTNILIMDEVFESLDESNIELVADLIKIKSSGSSVHLTTHHKSFDISSTSILELELDSYQHTLAVN